MFAPRESGLILGSAWPCVRVVVVGGGGVANLFSTNASQAHQFTTTPY